MSARRENPIERRGEEEEEDEEKEASLFKAGGRRGLRSAFAIARGEREICTLPSVSQKGGPIPPSTIGTLPKSQSYHLFNLSFSSSHLLILSSASL